MHGIKLTVGDDFPDMRCKLVILQNNAAANMTINGVYTLSSGGGELRLPVGNTNHIRFTGTATHVLDVLVIE